MQASELLHHLVTGSHMKMISVGQLHLCFDLLQILRGHRALNRSDGSHIHENRGLDRSVYGHQLSPLRSSFLSDQTIHSLNFPLSSGQTEDSGPVRIIYKITAVSVFWQASGQERLFIISYSSFPIKLARGVDRGYNGGYSSLVRQNQAAVVLARTDDWL